MLTHRIRQGTPRLLIVPSIPQSHSVEFLELLRSQSPTPFADYLQPDIDSLTATSNEKPRDGNPGVSLSVAAVIWNLINTVPLLR
jgi:hypothetical protein